MRTDALCDLQILRTSRTCPSTQWCVYKKIWFREFFAYSANCFACWRWITHVRTGRWLFATWCFPLCDLTDCWTSHKRLEWSSSRLHHTNVQNGHLPTRHTTLSSTSWFKKSKTQKWLHSDRKTIRDHRLVRVKLRAWRTTIISIDFIGLQLAKVR